MYLKKNAKHFCARFIKLFFLKKLFKRAAKIIRVNQGCKKTQGRFQ
jgi:hypothetical protein